MQLRMSKVITFQRCGMMLDALYHNALKEKTRQRSLSELAKDCETSIGPMTRMRDILIDLKLLIKEGNARGQKIYWHPDKVGMNHHLQQKVYSEYIRDAKSHGKVGTTTHRGRVSLDAALKVLVQLGFTGEIKRTISYNGPKKTIEVIDLTQIKVEE